ncbi:hypothetical protein TUM12370_14080 [Salmonella enterica subsp. enterica serovar Choleraesuis]|nr:hypothetical protein TUM12370_14080 [Salmonella enterica subsp. enterica serovar Choleraesuis]
MKKIALVVATLVMGGCAQIDNYKEVVKTPPPMGLEGVWQSQGPQSSLVSAEAIASVIITADGDTLDCRQWKRTIAVPGKLALISDDYTNITSKLEVYPIERSGETMEYDGMTLRRVDRPTPECIIALSKQTFATDDMKDQAQQMEDTQDPDAASVVTEADLKAKAAADRAKAAAERAEAAAQQAENPDAVNDDSNAVTPDTQPVAPAPADSSTVPETETAPTSESNTAPVSETPPTSESNTVPETETAPTTDSTSTATTGTETSSAEGSNSNLTTTPAPDAEPVTTAAPGVISATPPGHMLPPKGILTTPGSSGRMLDPAPTPAPATSAQ